MTETTCPTCGAKCNTTKKPQYKNSEYVDYFALPPPDLTKLREAFEPFNPDHDDDHVHAAWCGHVEEREEITNLLQAVKELLEDK